MNSDMLLGFQDEMQKLSASAEDGIKGLGVGAILGALVSAVGVEALEKLVTRNKDLAIITGAIMGAGALGGAGYLLGGKQSVTNATQALPPGVIIHGAPAPGTPVDSLRHMP